MKTTRRAARPARHKPVSRTQGIVIGTVLLPAVLDRIDQLAKREGRTRSNVAARAIDRGLPFLEGR